jgi:hypothetical protein
MKHRLEDEYVSYNVHLAPILGYETPVRVTLSIYRDDLQRVRIIMCHITFLTHYKFYSIF